MDYSGAQHPSQPTLARALAAQNQRLQLATQALQGYVYDWHLRDERVERTEGFGALFGIASDAVSVADWREQWVLPEDRAPVEAALDAAMAGGQTVMHAEYRVRGPDGRVFWLADHMRLVPDAAGKVVRIVGNVHDVTGRKEIEARLVESEARFRTIFEQTNDFVFTADLAQRITSCNPAVAAAIGLPTEALIGRSIAEFISPGDFERTTGMLAAKLREGGTTHYEVEVGAVDGRRMVWDINSRLTTDRDGRPNGLHAIARDVTERRHADTERRLLLDAERTARAEAEAANRLKDDFLATLSHELRTPISNVVSWARVLQKKFADRDPLLARGLEIIVENAHAQARMITDLLDVSRVLSGKVQLEARPADLGAFVEGVLAGQRPEAEARGLELQLVRLPEGPRVVLDAARFQPVLWNLLANAFKFTPAGGRVCVSVGTEGAQAIVSVADTGAGIAAEFLPSVFDRFRQAEGGSSRRHGGLGLGLAIVKQVVELHGGRVAAASAGVGQGATFTIRLPLAPDGDASTVADATGTWAVEALEDESTALVGLRVLAVEDQPHMRELLARVLLEHGAEVTAVPGAPEALEALARDDYSVLVSDLGLPQMDGFALLRRIRETLPAEQLPAIAVTAYARGEDRARALAAGFQAYLTKPYEVGRLIAAVRRWGAR